MSSNFTVKSDGHLVRIVRRAWASFWAIVLVAGSVAALSAATNGGPPSVAPSSVAPLTASAEVSGFTVNVRDARADAFHVEVEVEIAGRTEVGDHLVFTPGPALLMPDGTTLDLVAGHDAGRSMTLRFDRTGDGVLSTGDELKLVMVGLRSRTASPFDLGDIDAHHSPAALARLSAASNAEVHKVNSNLSLGPGTAVITDVAIDGNRTRVAGYLTGYSRAEIQATTLSDTVGLGSDGVSIRPVSLRSGFGPEGSRWEFDFDTPLGSLDALRLSLRLDAPASLPQEELGRVLAYRATPAIASVDLTALHAP